MLAKDRQREIALLVMRSGSVRVDLLSERFVVSHETIRRDLAQLEKMGRLKRSHGGAVRLDNSDYSLTFGEREIQNIKEKQAIAQVAVQCIKQGDAIILDASTTAWQMAKLLPDMPLTVLTTSVKVIATLSHCKNIRIIGTGGEFSHTYMAFFGNVAEDTIRSYHVDKAFISCGGCDLNYGISETSESRASLKKRMLASADESYLLVDSSKIGEKKLVHISKLENFKYLITDKVSTKAFEEGLKQKEIELLIS
jgi:DeoR/GlpR family transcriptional regulator of sugar metabolism